MTSYLQVQLERSTDEMLTGPNDPMTVMLMRERIKTYTDMLEDIQKQKDPVEKSE